MRESKKGIPHCGIVHIHGIFCEVNYAQNEKYFLFLHKQICHPISYFVLFFQGTPLYMAPELIEEKPYDLAADLGLTQLNTVGEVMLHFLEIAWTFSVCWKPGG